MGSTNRLPTNTGSLNGNVLSSVSLHSTFQLAATDWHVVLTQQGTNAAIWSVIAMFGYIQAQVNGEELAELKQSRGRGGGSKA